MSWGRSKKQKGNLVQKTLGLKEEIDPLKKERNSIQMNEIDREIFHDMVDNYEVMQENLQTGLNEYSPFDSLSEDIYQSLFSYNAKMNDEEDMQNSSRLNHQMMENLMESEDYQNLRKNTRFDTMGSAIGTEVLQNKAMEQIQYYKSQYLEQQRTGQPQPGGDAGELIDQLNQAQNLQNQIDGLNAKGSNGQGLTRAEANRLAQLQQQLNDLQDEIDHNTDGQQEMQQGMNQAMNQAAKKAHQEVGEIRDAVESWGLDGASSGVRISLDKRKKAIERIRRSSRLRDLTDLIGRMKAIAMNKKSQRVPDGHSIRTVELGNDLTKVLPSELMKLGNPTMKKEFMKKYSEKQLMQYKKDGVKQVGRGPIVLGHDKSGSMDDSRDNWATALALATLEVAQKEKRNFGYIPYQSHVIKSGVKNIPAGELDPDDIMDIAELDTGGGTNFMAALDEALNCITSDRYKKGDILFITDGDAGVSDEWLKKFLKAKEEYKFFVHTVIINIGGHASRGTIDKFSDHVTVLSTLADLDPANAKQIFNIMDDDTKHDAHPQPDPNAQP